MPQSRHRKKSSRKSNPRATYSKKSSGSRAKLITIFVIAALAITAVGLIIAGGGKDSPAPASDNLITTPSGLRYEDIEEGTGDSPAPGQTVVVHYTGTLNNGTVFDSSRNREPFEFVLGTGTVIKGWDEGIKSMKVGGKRRLVIPPHLGYGATGSPPKIPPQATLFFDVELLDIKKR